MKTKCENTDCVKTASTVTVFGNYDHHNIRVDSIGVMFLCKQHAELKKIGELGYIREIPDNDGDECDVCGKSRLPCRCLKQTETINIGLNRCVLCGKSCTHSEHYSRKYFHRACDIEHIRREINGLCLKCGRESKKTKTELLCENCNINSKYTGYHGCAQHVEV